MLGLIKGTVGSQKSLNMLDSEKILGDQVHLEETTKILRNKAPVRSQQMCSNMPQNLTQKHLVKKHKRLTDNAAGNHLKAPSNVIGGNSAALPYRVSRVAQPTQHKQFQVINEQRRSDEDDEQLDDTWI